MRDTTDLRIRSLAPSTLGRFGFLACSRLLTAFSLVPEV
jgi:hypothetical protein